MVLQHTETGPFAVTVFESPVPARVGMVDLSILLQTSGTLEPVLDARVDLELTHGDSRLRTRVTRQQAQNRMLYAASVQIGAAAVWHYNFRVTPASGGTPVTVEGDITVSPGEAGLDAYRIYLVLPFLCLAVFALHQRLKWRTARKAG